MNLLHKMQEREDGREENKDEMVETGPQCSGIITTSLWNYRSYFHKFIASLMASANNPKPVFVNMSPGSYANL